MNLYEIRLRETGEIVTRGTARQCAAFFGRTVDAFRAFVYRNRHKADSVFTVNMWRGGETDYPVLGANTPPLKSTTGGRENNYG